MAAPETVSILIPAFNEGPVVADVIGALRATANWHEIILVDDGSSDETAASAEAAGARVLRHPYNKGNGAAVKTGIRAASAQSAHEDPQSGFARLAPVRALASVRRPGFPRESRSRLPSRCSLIALDAALSAPRGALSCATASCSPV